MMGPMGLGISAGHGLLEIQVVTLLLQVHQGLLGQSSPIDRSFEEDSQSYFLHTVPRYYS